MEGLLKRSNRGLGSTHHCLGSRKCRHVVDADQEKQLSGETYFPGKEGSFSLYHSGLNLSYMHHKAQSNAWDAGKYVTISRS